MGCKGEESRLEKSAPSASRFEAFGFEPSGGGLESIESTSGTCATWYRAYQKALSSKDEDTDGQLVEVFFPESPEAVSDGMIHSRIIFALFADSDVDDTHIGVRVEKGRVTLGGSVGNDRHKHRAANLAMRQKGVAAVQNNLHVASRHLDHSIAENVKAVLESFTLIGTEAVEVNVDRGTVILRGRVPNQTAREAAGRIAWRTPGVVEVRNQLNVQGAHG
jgi:osmotically-inducible protein OsmY